MNKEEVMEKGFAELVMSFGSQSELKDAIEALKLAKEEVDQAVKESQDMLAAVQAEIAESKMQKMDAEEQKKLAHQALVELGKEQKLYKETQAKVLAQQKDAEEKLAIAMEKEARAERMVQVFEKEKADVMAQAAQAMEYKKAVMDKVLEIKKIMDSI
jgi:chromosome segregation ATPase